MEERRDELLQIGKSEKEVLGKQSNTAIALKYVNTLFQAYIDAILEYANINDLAKMIDEIPGANAFKSFFVQASCPNVDPYKIGIDDLWGSLKIGFCEDGANSYILGQVPKIPELQAVSIKAVLKLMLGSLKML